ncbi:hypothetical protein [Pseudogracilibacillus sp. SO30301A]
MIYRKGFWVNLFTYPAGERVLSLAGVLILMKGVSFTVRLSRINTI